MSDAPQQQSLSQLAVIIPVALIAAVGAFFGVKALMKPEEKAPAEPAPAEPNQQSLTTKISQNNLKQLGLALWNYEETFAVFPPGGIANAKGTEFHSWSTMMLPMLEQSAIFNQIDFNTPWKDPKNVELMKKPIPTLHFAGSKHTAEGFGVNQYAANSHLFFRNSSTRLRDIKAGMSNTLGFGEAGGSFAAWGEPTNYRDPLLGFNAGPKSFGNPDSESTQFLMLDGTVREIKHDIAPDVLRGLSGAE